MAKYIVVIRVIEIDKKDESHTVEEWEIVASDNINYIRRLYSLVVKAAEFITELI